MAPIQGQIDDVNDSFNILRGMEVDMSHTKVQLLNSRWAALKSYISERVKQLQEVPTRSASSAGHGGAFESTEFVNGLCFCFVDEITH